MYDVTVIGGGVVGALILRELAKYNIKALLLEAEDDVSKGTSGANSGIVHSGYDCQPGSKKAYFNVQGNAMLPQLAKELHVPYEMTGSLVVADESEKQGLEELYQRGLENGVEVELIERKRILEIEPNVANNIKYALWAPKAGIVSPYKLTIDATDNAVLNGAEIKLEKRVSEIKKTDYGYEVVTEDKSTYKTKVLINAAGQGCLEINKLLSDEVYDAQYRRGDYYVLDKSQRKKINTVIIPLPDHRGKGVLVAPTADGNVLYGPSAVATGPGDIAVEQRGLEKIRQSLLETYKAADFSKAIRVFAGLRIAIGDDFIIKQSKLNKGYIMLLGICSPGLTAAPAIAKYVVEELVSKNMKLDKKPQIKYLKKPIKIAQLSGDEINNLVKEEPLWGRIVCRCETVSEKEIVNAIRSPLPCITVDGIKRRARAGMGRCQGGFCMPAIIKIISREAGIPLTEVKKGGQQSVITYEKI